MAKLAIKGHAIRDNEVIEILEMLGGRNPTKLQGNASSCGYYIDSDGNIAYHYSLNEFIQFTIEEFLERFPYKIGDKVIVKGYKQVFEILSMRWCSERNDIMYSVSNEWFYTEELQLYKEETMKDRPNLLQQLKEYFENTPREVVEKEWREYDKYNEIGPSVEEYLEYINNIRQPQYPKNYEECCKILNIPSNGNIAYVGNWVYGGEYLEKHLDRLRKFQQLLICRDAYWKLSGDEMGLDKLWKPYNGQESCKKYVIQTVYGKVTCLDTWCQTRNILEFPTAEIRDTFYEHFKKLIEDCKELL